MGSSCDNSGRGRVDTRGVLDPVMIAAIDRSVGRRVRDRRIVLRLSQDNIAESMRLSVQQVHKYERGVNRISASRLYQLALLLAVPVSYFFDDVPALLEPELGANAQGDPLVSAMLSKETQDLVSALDAVGTAAGRRAFTRLLEAMKSPGRSGLETGDGWDRGR